MVGGPSACHHCQPCSCSKQGSCDEKAPDRLSKELMAKGTFCSVGTGPAHVKLACMRATWRHSMLILQSQYAGVLCPDQKSWTIQTGWDRSTMPSLTQPARLGKPAEGGSCQAFHGLPDKSRCYTCHFRSDTRIQKI